MIKNNCYNCKYRGSLPGNAHSQCLHPDIGTKGSSTDILSGLMSVLKSGSLGKLPSGIKANAHGIAKGWFFFPFDFDPIWLEQCDYFVSANAEKAEVIEVKTEESNNNTINDVK